MLRKTKKVISIACILIFILPIRSYSMDKEEFLKFLIESSYPESSTNNDNSKEEKDKEIKAQASQKIEKFKNKVYRTFKTVLEENGCIGSISELYDSAKPQLPKGAIAQAWSVAEIFRIIF